MSEEKLETSQGEEQQSINPVENVQDVQKELEAFKSNPENKKKAILLAKQIQAVFEKRHDQWFSLKQLSKRVKESEQQMYFKLKMLQLFNLCTAKVWKSSTRFTKGELVFRIHLGVEQEIQSLDEIITSLQSEIEAYKTKRAALQQQLIATELATQN